LGAQNALFSGCGGEAFLLGVLQNPVVETWFFDGEFVVECVIEMVSLWTDFRREKCALFFDFF